MCELKEIRYLIAVPSSKTSLLAAAIVANKPMQIQDVTSYETATVMFTYMRVVLNCCAGLSWCEYVR